MMPINPMTQNARASTYSLKHGSPVLGATPGHGHVRNSSLGAISNPGGIMPRPNSTVYPVMSSSTDNLGLHPNSSPNLRAQRTSVMMNSRPGSQLNLLDARGSSMNLGGPVNFMDAPTAGPTDESIILAVRECLSEVDIEQVTKKHVVALAELKLQCQHTGERKAFLSSTIDRELAAME